MKNILVINLRDQIAISAMNAIIRADDTHSETLESIAIESYQYADAMLKARSQVDTEQNKGVDDER